MPKRTRDSKAEAAAQPSNRRVLRSQTQKSTKESVERAAELEEGRQERRRRAQRRVDREAEEVAAADEEEETLEAIRAAQVSPNPMDVLEMMAVKVEDGIEEPVTERDKPLITVKVEDGEPIDLDTLLTAHSTIETTMEPEPVEPVFEIDDFADQPIDDHLIVDQPSNEDVSRTLLYEPPSPQHQKAFVFSLATRLNKDASLPTKIQKRFAAAALVAHRICFPPVGLQLLMASIPSTGFRDKVLGVAKALNLSVDDEENGDVCGDEATAEDVMKSQLATGQSEVQIIDMLLDPSVPPDLNEEKKKFAESVIIANALTFSGGRTPPSRPAAQQLSFFGVLIIETAAAFSVFADEHDHNDDKSGMSDKEYGDEDSGPATPDNFNEDPDGNGIGFVVSDLLQSLIRQCEIGEDAETRLVRTTSSVEPNVPAKGSNDAEPTLKRKNTEAQHEQAKRTCIRQEARQFVAFLTSSTRPTTDAFLDILKELNLMEKDDEFSWYKTFTNCSLASLWCVHFSATGGLLNRIKSILDDPLIITAMNTMNRKAFGNENGKYVLISGVLDELETATTSFLLLLQKKIGYHICDVDWCDLVVKDRRLTIAEAWSEYPVLSREAFKLLNKNARRRLQKRHGFETFRTSLLAETSTPIN